MENMNLFNELLKVEKSLSRKSNEDDLSSNPFFRK